MNKEQIVLQIWLDNQQRWVVGEMPKERVWFLPSMEFDAFAKVQAAMADTPEKKAERKAIEDKKHAQWYEGEAPKPYLFFRVPLLFLVFASGSPISMSIMARATSPKSANSATILINGGGVWGGTEERRRGGRRRVFLVLK